MSLLNITKEQLRATIRSIWQGERPDADDTRYSDLWLYSRIASVVVWRMLQTIDRGVNAIFPTTSFGVYLENWLNWIGAPDGTGNGTFGRIVARGSTGTDAIAVTATGAGPWVDLQNYELTDDSAGKTYKINQSYVFAVAGTVNLDIAAVDVGAATNLESAATMTFTSPPAGITAAAVLVEDLDDGADRETDAEGRARLLGLLRNPPASGNVADWVSTVKAVSPGNFNVYVWPQRQSYPYGYGMTDYCALQKNETGVDRAIGSSDDFYTAIDTAIDENMPALLYRNSRQLTLFSVLTDVDISIVLGSQATSDQKTDWDSQGNKTTVSTSDNTTGIIVASGSVTSLTVINGIAVDDRVVINGYEGTVTAIDGAADTTFTVAAWPSEWGVNPNPLNGLNITSGGGFIGRLDTTITSVVQTGYGIVQAVSDYMDGRGPNVLQSAAQSEIAGWDSTARIQELESTTFVVGEGNITSAAVDDLGGGVADLSHSAETGATASIYDVDEITVWQTYVA